MDYDQTEIAASYDKARALAPSSENDFQQGMAALRTPGDAINQNDAVTEEIDWFVFVRRG
jgi:hypothetical protein